MTIFDDWKARTGKGFRMTKDQKERGLSREKAIAEATGGALPQSSLKVPMPKVKASRSRSGDIIIRVRPEAGIDSDYFEHLDQKEIEVVLPATFYSWFDTKAKMPYQGDLGLLITHLLMRGMHTIIPQFQFPEDLEDWKKKSR